MVASVNQGSEEVKIFEQKFKGSLEKLDEFERDWANFKSNQATTQSLTPLITGRLKDY
jgi:hypothetical protein